MKQIVKERNDIVFYLKLYPIIQLHPQAYDKSKAIVCEEDNEKALKLLEDVYARRTIASSSCKTDVINKNIQIANKLGVTGTPTLIFTDGFKTSGAMQKEALLQLIDSHSKP